jgi:hypothetical protein
MTAIAKVLLCIFHKLHYKYFLKTVLQVSARQLPHPDGPDGFKKKREKREITASTACSA